MEKKDIVNEVTSIISKIKNSKLDNKQINEETLINSLGLNSLSYIRMIVLIENKFNVKIYDAINEFDNKDLFTVGNLCDYIVKLV